MNRGRVLNLSGLKVLEIIKTNAHSLICFLVLIIGVVCGLFMFNDFEAVTNFLEGFFNDFLKSRDGKSFISIVLSSYLHDLLLFLIVFIFGTTLFGVVTVPLSLGFCGFFHGAAVAYLYSSFALKGVAFNAVIFLPAVIVLLIFLIFAAKHSLMFSLQIARLTLPDSPQENLYIKFKDYALHFLILTLGAISSALLDGLTSITMLRFFEF